MAAVQPFLSGAISKTVALPKDISVEEIEKIYVNAWKMGLKAVALYRDGSKRLQPYSTKAEKEGYEKTFNEFNKIIGIKFLNFFHLNDSKSDLGAYLDRHEHIGKGKLGLDVFRFIINDDRFKKIGKCLETPKGKNKEFDKINLNILRNLKDN